MKQLSYRLEVTMTPEQNKELTRLAQERNIPKSELIRRAISNPELINQRTKKDLQLYRKLGELNQEIKKRREEYLGNPIETLDRIIKEIDKLRLEIIKK